jgi:hypothetical protein
MNRSDEVAALPPQTAPSPTCPACGEGGGRVFHEVAAVPAQSAVLYGSAEAARRVPRSHIALVHCAACDFVFNARFDPTLIDESLTYEDSQGFSVTFNAYARRLAQDVVDRHGLGGRPVSEIGCGKGEFLSLLCERGASEGVGIDPIADPSRIPPALSGRLHLVRERLAVHHGPLLGELVCCRHILEHVADAGEFVRTLRAAIGERDIPVLFEVPDSWRVLHEGAFEDVYHEHCGYFTASSLERLFARSGFDVLAVRQAYGDQYLLLEARPSGRLPPAGRSDGVAVAGEGRAVGRAVAAFGRRAAERTHHWRTLIRARAAAGKRIAIWGSGSKAVAFFSAVGCPSEVTCLVDINPFRRGHYTPGTGHLIVAPRDLPAIRPDVVIVMNHLYQDEVAAELDRLGLSVELLAVGENDPGLEA